MTITATLILTVALNGIVTGTTRVQVTDLETCHAHGQRMVAAPGSPWVGYECRERKPREARKQRDTQPTVARDPLRHL